MVEEEARDWTDKSKTKYDLAEVDAPDICSVEGNDDGSKTTMNYNFKNQQYKYKKKVQG